MTIRTARARGAPDPRRRKAVRDAARALRQRDRRQDRAANSSPPSSPSATRGSNAPASRAISSSPTSRRARAACATSTRCSGSPNMSIACAIRANSSTPACSRSANSRCSRRCEEFLWSVRCHLHFLTGRAEERLSFDLQRPIAERLGYAARAGQADVERFMKHYFLVAKDVGDLTAIVCAALEERQAKPTQAFDRFLGRLRRRPRRSRTRRISHRQRPRQRHPTPTRSSAIPSISSASSGSPTDRACRSIPTRRGSSPSR